MKIDYNAPFTLTFSLLCLIVFLLNTVFPGVTSSFFTLFPEFNLADPSWWMRLCGYVFGHADLNHLIGNLSFILLLGPLLEEKYGTKYLLIMCICVALITSIIFISFYNFALLGASGIVFMFIMLTSFSNVKANHIPLTFLLVLVLFLGKEIMDSFKADQISQSAHLIGGICGSFFGFYLLKMRSVR